MISQEFSSAKSIVDFYTSKLSADTEDPGANFAMQYAHLQLLKLRTTASLDTLESYDIKVS
jgi:hypothetical protein